VKAIIPVVSTASLRRRYNHLLASEWKKSTLEQVLNLLWDEIAISNRPLHVPFHEALNPHRHHAGESDFSQEVFDEIVDFRHHFRGDGIIPDMPKELPKDKRVKLLVQAETTWTFLIMQNLAEVRGDVGFFADTQSILFLVAVDFLLPQLRDRGYEPEHACLVNALYMHSYITWTQDPQRQAHHFFLQAVLMNYLGHPGLRRENLLQALRVTPLEDHSFLTKVQAYVFSLMDDGDYRLARNFLLELYRRAPEAYLQEIGEMIDDVHHQASVAQ
jgi:hypothetical protein